MANRCANTAATRILYLHEEAVLRKKHVINQAIAALRRSVGLPGQFVTVWKNRTGHTHIQNYCNPVEYAHQGLIIATVKMAATFVLHHERADIFSCY